MKTVLFVATATAAVASSSYAGFLGFVANVRTVGAYTVIDVFAGVANSSDKYLNTYNLNASTGAAGGFYQAAGLQNKTWKPDAAGFASTRNSIDSFMTAGTYSGGAYGTEYYASSNTNGDPNFTVPGNYWNATPGSPAASTIPALAGWYTGDPPSIDNRAESLASAITGVRVNGAGSASSAAFGIWCSHIVVLTAGGTGSILSFDASQSIKDGLTGAVSQAQNVLTIAVPAPGALALLGLAGFAARRRRA